MKTVLIIIAIIVILYLFLFGKGARAIRSINNLINKDRSVCDVINDYSEWNISPVKVDGTKLIVNSTLGGTYNLYLTFNNQRPTNDELTLLNHYLTNEDSVITVAHRLNMPVDKYLQEETKYSERLQFGDEADLNDYVQYMGKYFNDFGCDFNTFVSYHTGTYELYTETKEQALRYTQDLYNSLRDRKELRCFHSEMNSKEEVEEYIENLIKQ